VTLLVNVPIPKIHALEASVIQSIYRPPASFDCRLQGRILKRFRINQQSRMLPGYRYSRRSKWLLRLEKAWLNPDFTEPEQIMPLLKMSLPDHMEFWRVADEAKNPRNDYPEIINPV
jgi:hypothetical protein